MRPYLSSYTLVPNIPENKKKSDFVSFHKIGQIRKKLLNLLEKKVTYSRNDFKSRKRFFKLINRLIAVMKTKHNKDQGC